MFKIKYLKNKHMKELVIKELQRLHKELSRNPKVPEFEKLNTFKISKRRLLKHFDTYTDALFEAGLQPRADRRGQGVVTLDCTQCSKEIVKNRSELKRSKNMFCSRSCAATFNNSLKPKKAEGLYTLREKTCSNCKSTYVKDGRDAKNTCSILCSMELGMKQRTMKEAIQRVGSNTYDAIRKNARAYSKHFFPAKCMICDYDKHYEVCHVKDLKDFTREETVYEVNNKTNLIHLCPNCHWEFDHNQLDIQKIREAQKAALTN